MSDTEMKDTKKTLEQALRTSELNFHQLVTAAVHGRVDLGKKYDSEELRKVLSESVAPLAQGRSAAGSSLYIPNNEVQLVSMRIEGTNINYLTLLIGGRVHLTTESDGTLDLSHPEMGLDILLDILASSSTIDPIRAVAEHKGKKKIGPRAKPSFKPTKERPGYVCDPILERYIVDNAEVLAYAALTGVRSYEGERTLKSMDELESVIEDRAFLDKAREHGITLAVQPIMGYIGLHRETLAKKVRRYVTAITEKEVVRRIVGQFVLSHIDSTDREKKRLKELCSSPEIGTDIYQRLVKERDSAGDDERGEHYVTCLREMVMTIFREMLTSQGTVTQDEFLQYRLTTRTWVAGAKAADYVKTDPLVQKEVIPLLRDGDISSFNDRMFRAMCSVGRKVLDPEHLYNPYLVHLIVRGLWMERLLEKEDKGSVTIRTQKGSMVEYTDGLTNLITRYSEYDSLLKASFDDLKAKEELPIDNIELDSQDRCSHLGQGLYKNLTDENQRKFSHLRDSSIPLKDTGSSLGRLLRLYVGINRDYFMKEIGEQRGGVSESE